MKAIAACVAFCVLWGVAVCHIYILVSRGRKFRKELRQLEKEESK
jgi:hypothetical protein